MKQAEAFELSMPYVNNPRNRTVTVHYHPFKGHVNTDPLLVSCKTACQGCRGGGRQERQSVQRRCRHEALASSVSAPCPPSHGEVHHVSIIPGCYFGDRGRKSLKEIALGKVPFLAGGAKCLLADIVDEIVARPASFASWFKTRRVIVAHVLDRRPCENVGSDQLQYACMSTHKTAYK
jgi:hypothetical protein